MPSMASSGAVPGVVGGMGAMAPAAGGAAMGAASTLPVGMNAVNNAGIALPQTPSLVPPAQTANVGANFQATPSNAPVVQSTASAPVPGASSVRELRSDRPIC